MTTLQRIHPQTNKPNPIGLHIFSLLPQPLIEHILVVSRTTYQDLYNLRSAAEISQVPELISAVNTAAFLLLRIHPHGHLLLPRRRPNESLLSLYRYAELLDGAMAPTRPVTVWSCGRNDSGQGVRHDPVESNAVLPTPPIPLTTLPSSEKAHGVVVIRLVAGAEHSACIIAGGALYVAGNNFRGQLGVGDFSSRAGWTLVSQLSETRIAQVACGDTHTVALTGDGQLLVTGCNHRGQLGIAQVRQSTSFCHIPLKRHVIMIAAGREHTVVLLDDGTVYATGSNELGQLGEKRNHGRKGFAPVNCFGQRVVRIACKFNTTMLLTTDNMVLLTGKRHGGFSVIGGLGTSNITHLSLGERFAIASTDQNEIAISRHGKRFFVTDELLSVDASYVSAGMRHYAIVTQQGNALASGLNAYGQVGAGQMGLGLHGSAHSTMFAPFDVPLSSVQIPVGYRALQVAAGSHHTLYLLEAVET